MAAPSHAQMRRRAALPAQGIRQKKTGLAARFFCMQR
jgi:hypothetical protein